jgi:DNA-binding NarL/FixJ family response regulator
MSTALDAADGDPPALSSNERRLVNLVAYGRRNREIATELDVMEQTVKNMLSSVYRKCGVRNRAELVRLAFTNGLVGGRTAASSKTLP